MTPNDKSLAIDLLDDAEESLSSCLDALRRLEAFARRNGLSGLSGRIRGYTIGNLEAFLGETNDYGDQIGSLKDIRDDLRDCQVDHDAE